MRLDYKNQKPLIVLKALLMGIELNNFPYGTQKIEKFVLADDYKPCLIGHKENTQTKEITEVLLGLDYYLNNFIIDCGRVSDEEIAIIAANIVLNESKG